MYRVIQAFFDLKDNNYSYRVGDVYPRAGFTPSAKRIEELSGTKNRQKTPLIVEEVEKAEKPKTTRRVKK